MQTAAEMKDPDFSGVLTFLASVGEASERVQHLSRHAVQASAMMAPGEAAVLAADIEAISRRVEYLQVVCAGALGRHRVIDSFGTGGSTGDVLGADGSDAGVTGVASSGSDCLPAEASGAERPGTGVTGVASSGSESQASSAHSADLSGWNNTWGQSEPSCEPGNSEKVRAEFRTTADYMRCRLRISRAEAQRRLRLAAYLVPSSSTSGQILPPDLPVLADASASGLVSSAAAAIVANAVDEIRYRTDAATGSTVEADLASLAVRQDTDFLVRAARRWVLLVDQDGAEPTVEELRRFQGVFPGRKKNGLNHLSIYCTDDQHETLLTVMNAAAGPRIQQAPAPGRDGEGPAHSGEGGDVMAAEGRVTNSPAGVEGRDGTPANPDTFSRSDVRTRPQRLLGGLVDAAKTALATGGVPASGGLRPQVLVTIDSASLLQTFDYGSLLKPMDGPEPQPKAPAGPENTPVSGSAAGYGQTAGPGHTAGYGHTPGPGHTPGYGQPAEHGNAVRPGNFAFSGPVSAATVRRLACDAELLPVVLSGEGRILDIGRAQRIFPPHLRKALHARDGGCAFPGCTIPGPWTEAHHIRHWNHGGPTSTDNGVLLCSHHHHEVHKENWHIDVRSGVPWFVPPAYVDPDRNPLRNTFFRAGLSSGYSGQASATIRVS